MPGGDGTGPGGRGPVPGGGGGMGRGGGQGRGRGPGGMGMGAGGECICPQCGYTQPHQRGVPCLSLQCPKCNINLTRKVN